MQVTPESVDSGVSCGGDTPHNLNLAAVDDLPGVNFTNILQFLRASFSYKSDLRTFSLITGRLLDYLSK